jgi:hypothetical protein
MTSMDGIRKASSGDILAGTCKHGVGGVYKALGLRFEGWSGVYLPNSDAASDLFDLLSSCL